MPAKYVLLLFFHQLEENLHNLAAMSVPKNLTIKASNEYGTRYGVWTKSLLLEDTIFGPYEGEVVQNEASDIRSEYSWGVSMWHCRLEQFTNFNAIVRMPYLG